MNVLIDINHPGHVHLFLHFYYLLKEKKNNIYVTVKNITSAIHLLDIYKIPYIFLGRKSDSLCGKALNQFFYDYKIFELFNKLKIHYAFGSSITVDHASFLSKTISFHLSDDDPKVVPLVIKYAHPFANHILCPDVLDFPKHRKKTIKYPGYHELAYLHPHRFQPDKKVLEEAGIKEEENYFILRFNSFKAHHDIGVKGLSLENKRKLISMLKPHGKIFITSERELETEFEEYRITIEPHKIHSFLYYATMFIGDSQTMTSEAAVLGVPSLRCNSFAGRISYLEEQEKKYGLTYAFLPENFDLLLDKLKELLKMPYLREEWQKRRQKMLADKIDVTAFMVWFIENYPQSREMVEDTEEFWGRFR